MAATRESFKSYVHLLGFCLILQVLTVPHAQGGPLLATNETETATSSSGDTDDDLCKESGLKKYADGRASKEEIELVYRRCQAEFLDKNPTGESVKKTVDEWVGTDLSKAEPNHIFLIYELVMTAPKPSQVDDQFERECKQMGDSFQKYWDTMEPLSDQIDISVSGLLGPEDEENEVEDQERELFNFVQYAQFCRSLLEDEDVEPDEWVYKAD